MTYLIFYDRFHNIVEHLIWYNQKIILHETGIIAVYPLVVAIIERKKNNI